MLKYFKKTRGGGETSQSHTTPTSTPTPPPGPSAPPNIEANLEDYPADPGLRKSVSEYDVNERNAVRLYYLTKGPCQPKNHNFPWHLCANEKRRFRPVWFNDHANWLEYSIAKDAAYCLYCYLFKTDNGGCFVSEGYTNWRKKENFNKHVGEPTSTHNKCVKAGGDLLKQKQHIEFSLTKQCSQTQANYRVRLTASIDCIRFLLRQGLGFRGHDESDESLNKGNFLELLQFLSDHNEEIEKIVLKKAPQNHTLTSPKIQKDIINSIAVKTTNAILAELGDDYFSILVDESRDISVKEQMTVVLRFVDIKGYVMECFLGLVHVSDTSALSLKAAVEGLLSTHGLSIASLRGQGYDGASNMRGEFNGLKSLILMENETAYYVHCFAHQLQLTLVAVAENYLKISAFFDLVTFLTNIVGASCKRRDILHEKQFEQVTIGICNGDILTGRGLNQELALKRAGETRWGSHYGTLVSLICLFSSIKDVLLIIEDDAKNRKHRGHAMNLNLMVLMQCFEFVFHLHLMKNVLGIANDLSQALQRKDQDIVNATTLVKITKQQLQQMRDDGWESLLEEASLFCVKHQIPVPSMEDLFVVIGRSRRNPEEATNYHHYRVEVFCTVIDLQIQELNNRFNEVNTELLLCMSCLDPSNSFSAYDKRKLIRFAEFYPTDFPPQVLMILEHQLDNYIVDLRFDDQFAGVMGVGGLARKLVQLKKDRVYPLVYLLVKLALLLPVATATVERVFSAMKIIKTSLRNQMGDDMMNDCLVSYIEREIVVAIDNEDIIRRFQNMKTRKVLL